MRETLKSMGYLPAGAERCATRWFPMSPEIPRYYERFAASIEAMVLHKSGEAPVPWEPALREFLRRVEGTGLSWWLYGSAAQAVRGAPVEPRDVDVHVDDAMRAGRLLDDLLVTPVERMRGWVADYAGRAFCHAIIEWIADPHDDPPSHLETVRWQGYDIRVPPA
jgi:hypothetical protein